MLLLLIGASLADEDETLDEVIDLTMPEASVQEDAPLRWRLGASLGLGLPVDVTAVAPTASATLSRALPTWGGRIRPQLSVAISRTSASGELSDPRLPESFSYQTNLLAVMLGAGAEVAFIPGGLGPYLLGAPLLNLSVTTSTGDGISPTHEGRASAGFIAGGGIVNPLGPGEIQGGIHYTHLKPGGVLAGEARARSITPTLAYRWIWGAR